MTIELFPFFLAMANQVLHQRYEISRILGKGGMGETYLAQDLTNPGLGYCVVKKLKPANEDPDYLVTCRRLFQREVDTLEFLGSHNQIPALLDSFEEHEDFYLVEEFIDGPTLATELVLGQPWPETQVLQLLQDVLEILDFIHGQSVIHRDIKPDNIIRRTQDQKLVLIDFGAVKQIRVKTAIAGHVSQTVGIGTDGYMPTEQASGKPRPASDIYALGKIGIQAITGLPPSQLLEDEDGEVLWNHLARASKEMEILLTQMTRHYFKLRYQNVSEVLAQIQGIQSACSESTMVSNPGSTLPIAPVAGSNYPPTVASGQTSPQGGSVNPVPNYGGRSAYEPTVVYSAPGNNQAHQTYSPNPSNSRSSVGLVPFAIAGLACVVAGFVTMMIIYDASNSFSNTDQTTAQSSSSSTAPSEGEGTSSSAIDSPPIAPEDAIVGEWSGRYNINQAPSTLMIDYKSGNNFYGSITTKSKGGGEVVLTIKGTIDPQTKQVLIEETEVLQQGRKSWLLGTNQGRINSDFTSMGGSGGDGKFTYAWNFTKE
ncbi:MAG: serine/threonine protein kinase [Synechococcaceae cyanobacterium RL_1_2]|nr:serine/threonine protein kinase [Synechococcaceae cyanobacterium RL_1_2]